MFSVKSDYKMTFAPKHDFDTKDIDPLALEYANLVIFGQVEVSDENTLVVLNADTKAIEPYHSSSFYYRSLWGVVADNGTTDFKRLSKDVAKLLDNSPHLMTRKLLKAVGTIPERTLISCLTRVFSTGWHEPFCVDKWKFITEKTAKKRVVWDKYLNLCGNKVDHINRCVRAGHEAIKPMLPAGHLGFPMSWSSLTSDDRRANNIKFIISFLRKWKFNQGNRGYFLSYSHTFPSLINSKAYDTSIYVNVEDSNIFIWNNATSARQMTVIEALSVPISSDDAKKVEEVKAEVKKEEPSIQGYVSLPTSPSLMPVIPEKKEEPPKQLPDVKHSMDNLFIPVPPLNLDLLNNVLDQGQQCMSDTTTSAPKKLQTLASAFSSFSNPSFPQINEFGGVHFPNPFGGANGASLNPFGGSSDSSNFDITGGFGSIKSQPNPFGGNSLSSTAINPFSLAASGFGGSTSAFTSVSTPKLPIPQPESKRVTEAKIIDISEDEEYQRTFELFRAELKEEKVAKERASNPTRHSILSQLASLTSRKEECFPDFIEVRRSTGRYLNLDTGKQLKQSSASEKKFVNVKEMICSGKLNQADFDTVCDLMSQLSKIEQSSAAPDTRNDLEKYIDDVFYERTLPPEMKRERITDSLRQELVHKSKGVCYSCLNKVNLSFHELGHIIPHKFGGEASIDNLRVTCVKCNDLCGSGHLHEMMLVENTPGLSQALLNDHIQIDYIESVRSHCDLIVATLNQFRISQTHQDRVRKICSDYKKYYLTIRKNLCARMTQSLRPSQV